jgi:hypothetical protein
MKEIFYIKVNILYIPGVEDLFEEGDRLLRVEHGKSRSCLISWRVWRSKEGEWRF